MAGVESVAVRLDSTQALPNHRLVRRVCSLADDGKYRRKTFVLAKVVESEGENSNSKSEKRMNKTERRRKRTMNCILV